MTVHVIWTVATIAALGFGFILGAIFAVLSETEAATRGEDLNHHDSGAPTCTSSDR